MNVTDRCLQSDAVPGSRGASGIIEAPSPGDGASTTSKPPITIKAHKTELAYLVLSRSGKLLASSSARGTLLRVFNVDSAGHLYSFRRGLTAAQVSTGSASFLFFFVFGVARLVCF